MYAVARVLDESSNSLFHFGAVTINDSLGHAAVLAVIDHAIAKTAVLR